MQVDLWIWVALVAFVLAMLAFDLFVFHRDAHVVSIREAGISTALWVTLGLGFGVIVWAWQGSSQASAYYAGYLVEYALSVDNVFVFALIFTYFAVPEKYQHRVLFWGVVGAIVMRAAFIAAGAALLEAFHVVIYVFGVFLVATAIRMARQHGHTIDVAQNPVMRLLRRVMPVSDTYHDQRFFIRHGSKLVATPLFAALVAVETSDVIFAIDSIPAIFAITTDTFIVFASNAFAILGLRALYFLLAGSMRKFAYLQVGLAGILGFVGIKMLLTDLYKIPIGLSLAVIVAILGTAIGASIVKDRRSSQPPITAEGA